MPVKRELITAIKMPFVLVLEKVLLVNVSLDIMTTKKFVMVCSQSLPLQFLKEKFEDTRGYAEAIHTYQRQN